MRAAREEADNARTKETLSPCVEGQLRRREESFGRHTKDGFIIPSPIQGARARPVNLNISCEWRRSVKPRRRREEEAAEKTFRRAVSALFSSGVDDLKHAHPFVLIICLMLKRRNFKYLPSLSVCSRCEKRDAYLSMKKKQTGKKC